MIEEIKPINPIMESHFNKNLDKFFMIKNYQKYSESSDNTKTFEDYLNEYKKSKEKKTIKKDSKEKELPKILPYFIDNMGADIPYCDINRVKMAYN